MNNAPIGMLDSGSGGLSIWRTVKELLPLESIVYIGDHLHMPYSMKTQSYIRKRTVCLIRFLRQKSAKLVVIACNSATVAGIDYYREQFPDIPIVGVVPVVKTASEVSKTRAFAVLATEFTAQSSYQKDLIARHAADCNVYNIGCTSLVGLVERGILDGPRIEKEIRTKLAPALAANVDVVALGCTHYPFLEPAIRVIVGNDVTILDSSGAVTRQIRRILKHNHAQAEPGALAYTYYTTGNSKHVSEIAKILLNMPVTFRYADV